MDDDWEVIAEKEVDVRSKAATNINKWAGEDDDDDVKDNWEDEEEKEEKEEKEDEEKSDSHIKVPVKTKSNEALEAKLEAQEGIAEGEEAKCIVIRTTSEEKLAEKLRLQKIQEESDLKSALDTFDPKSKENFNEFGATLARKLAQYKQSPHFPQFAEGLVRSICLNLSATDMKKVKINIESLHSEKLKLEKQTSKKSGNKGKAKATLRTETNEIDGYQKYGNDYADDYDDFM